MALLQSSLNTNVTFSLVLFLYLSMSNFFLLISTGILYIMGYINPLLFVLMWSSELLGYFGVNFIMMLLKSWWQFFNNLNFNLINICKKKSFVTTSRNKEIISKAKKYLLILFLTCHQTHIEHWGQWTFFGKGYWKSSPSLLLSPPDPLHSTAPIPRTDPWRHTNSAHRWCRMSSWTYRGILALMLSAVPWRSLK